MDRGKEMTMPLTTTIGAVASAAGAVLLSGVAAVEGGPEAPFLQYGALGLAGLMVWFGFRNNENTRRDTIARERILSDIIDANRKSLEKLHEETRKILTDAIDRNTRVMEGCVEHQRGGKVRT